MRRLRMLLVGFALFVPVGSHQTEAAAGRCDQTHCGWKCSVYGPIAGYCTAPADPESGCIQLYGPDCVSLQGAYCCRLSAGAL